MKFEVIRKSHKKSIIVGVSLFVILAVVIIAKFTFAKYSLVKSIKIAEGTINYKVPDFKIMAMYKNDGTGDTPIDTMPESGYVINETKSYCTLDNINKDTKAKLFTNEDGKHVISGLSKSDKCYLYFDKKLSIGETILANVTVRDGSPDFNKTAQATCSDAATCETTNGVYKAEDNDGISYYFRGSVENNYIKFGKYGNVYRGYGSSTNVFKDYNTLMECQNASSYNYNCTSMVGKDIYWRIIRINGDGSIRLIYDGTSARANGTSTSDSIAVSSQRFNSNHNNAYVGFKYTIGQLRGLGTKSNALEQIETWYTINLASYANKIDTNAGFCGDRASYIKTTPPASGGGTGTTMTFYGGYIRLQTNKSPVLTCADANDLYTTSSSNKGNKSLTYPIGLITADEVSMAGGVVGINNTSYYLYNGQDYWTISPYNFSSCAMMFVVSSFGQLYRTLSSAITTSNATPYGISPVINLRSDVQFTFNGTGEKGSISNPYIVT